MPVLLLVLSMLTTAVLLATVVATGRPDERESAAPAPRRAERIHGRILFVARYDDQLVLDCVAGACHPAQRSLAPGTPFALTVAPAGPAWFGDAVAAMVARWAEEDAVVDFLVVVGPEGERVDVHGDRSRVRLDVRARAGLG
jgi:hypothetical protein